MFQNNWVRLGVLTFLHFAVDFYGGLLIPLPEPTLTEHFAIDIGWVALLVGGCAFLVNLVQPVSGWLLPKKGLPIILLIAPLCAALTSCIGLTQSVVAAVAMLTVASLGIGILHPEAALAAHSLAGKHQGLGVSIFMAGGYFGFALGGLVAGVWVEYRDQGLNNFWMLAMLAGVVATLVFISGLHKLEGHVQEEPASQPGDLPFAPILALCVVIAANICTLVRFITILLVREFPGQDGQGWGGAAVFATGAFGGIGAFLWGHLSERFGRARMILAMQFLGAPFLYMMINVDTPSMAPVWGLGVGITMGGVFPLSVVLARQSSGLSQRLRMGLAIGGAWASGEVLFILGGKYVDLFAPGDAQPVANVLSCCWFLLAATAVLATVVSVLEKKTSSAGLNGESTSSGRLAANGGR